MENKSICPFVGIILYNKDCKTNWAIAVRNGSRWGIQYVYPDGRSGILTYGKEEVGLTDRTMSSKWELQGVGAPCAPTVIVELANTIRSKYDKSRRLELGEYVTKSSGKTQEFKTGAHRDKQVGKGRYDLIPASSLRRLAGIYERGAELYGERNWEKGMPLTRYLDSAIRHIFQCLEGNEEEDHAAAAVWNMFGFMHTKELIEKGGLPGNLDNIPKYNIEEEVKDSEIIEEKDYVPLRSSGSFK